ncbi:MAG: AAA family ATPase [Oscillospiraceae bacterium]|nr:AAA family ATPase [Oscillospiraceae bacterium]
MTKEHQPKAYLICGNICTGKTYLAKQLSTENNAVILSCDEIENDLFQKNLGSAHDEMAKRIHSFLLKKAAEIIEHGTSIILDWGFWRKSDRQSTSNYFKSLNIPYEWHYMDTSPEQRSKNIEYRNRAVRNGESTDYFVDEGLLNKCNTLFEPPSREEIDVWHDQK